jgi:hypothetical protein
MILDPFDALIKLRFNMIYFYRHFLTTSTDVKMNQRSSCISTVVLIIGDQNLTKRVAFDSHLFVAIVS